jgi:hypothetical protein
VTIRLQSPSVLKRIYLCAPVGQAAHGLGHVAKRVVKCGVVVTVARAGNGENNHINTMTTNSQFSLANRKQLADLLANKYEGLRYNAKQRFGKKRDELRASFIKELAEKKGALTVYRKIEAAKDQIQDLESELAGLGFDLNYSGHLELSRDGVNLHSKTIDARVAKEIGTLDSIDARFDSAQLAMMTVASLEDAEKLLKSVSEI